MNQNRFTIEKEQIVGNNKWENTNVLKYDGQFAGILGDDLSKLSHEKLIQIILTSVEMAHLMGERAVSARLRDLIPKLEEAMGNLETSLELRNG